MREYASRLKPDAIVHLGDYFDDGAVLAEEFPGLQVHQVPGNCDRYRYTGMKPEILCYNVCGVRLYMTHGHLHRVKYGTYAVIRDAREAGAQAVLFGHTHEPLCQQEDDGLWVLNPGSCGYGGSAGLIETKHSNIIGCRILQPSDLEETQ
jgi:putative phosphoesterase